MHQPFAFFRDKNPLPNHTTLDWSKFKDFADNCQTMTESCIGWHPEIFTLGDTLKYSRWVSQYIVSFSVARFVCFRTENIMGKGWNSHIQHFSVFPTMFSKGFVNGRWNQGLFEWMNEWMNSVLRPVDNLGHIGLTYLKYNNARWK